MSDDHEPQKGDKFYYKPRFLNGAKQPNGKIIAVLREEQQILVMFYDMPVELEYFDISAIEGHWRDRYKDWHLLDEI